MYQQQGVISQNQKNSISQKFPNRSFHVIHQNVPIFILHIAALLVFMAIFFNLKFSSGAVCVVKYFQTFFTETKAVLYTL